MFTRLGVRQCVEMVAKVIAADGSNCLELIIRQLAIEMPSRGGKGIEELVIRVIHLVHLEDEKRLSLWPRIIPSKR